MATRQKKIAVVMTHGIGEQYPMETLTSFVQAAWVENKDVQWKPPGDEKADDIWFKPDDPVTGSNELRRITTRWTEGHGPRVDFFEFYWADLAEGATVEEVWDWLRTLLWRPLSRVPPGVTGAWLLLWFVTLVIGGLSIAAVLPWPGAWWHALLAAAAAAVAYGMQYVVTPYAGDVARYVRADPRNIAMRRAIRERGLKLLTELHKCGSYERIIFVAHSLGTIVAYDLVSLLWTMRQDALLMYEGSPAFERLREVEAAAHALDANNSEQARAAYRNAQRRFRLELRSGGADGAGAQRKSDDEWLISDLITLGSPLTHAQFLMVHDQVALNERIERWWYSTNPPQFQQIDSEQRDKINDRPNPPAPPEVMGPPGGLFSFFFSKPGLWSMHHAAPFAAVRWTNIFDPHRWIFFGDIISGPLADVFGHGITDIDLRDLRGPAKGFSHTRYWSLEEGPDAAPIKALQQAINLLDKEQ